jgi:hypothetical protein
VTKRQADIDGERHQRQPRTTPDMVTKPPHYGPSQIFVRLSSTAILAGSLRRSMHSCRINWRWRCASYIFEVSSLSEHLSYHTRLTLKSLD